MCVIQICAHYLIAARVGASWSRLVADPIITSPMSSAGAIQRLVDTCTVEKRLDDQNYVCPHYHEALTLAFQKEPQDKLYTSEAFCEVSEAFMLGLRGAARIPNMGTGPLFNIKVSWKCESIVLEAVTPKQKLDASKLADFLYSMCVNQDCAHYLPSRTRWCKLEQAPTHSNEVCDGLSRYARDEADAMGPAWMSPQEVCGVYHGFAEGMGTNVEAYEHVMHLDSNLRVPVPDDQARALGSSRLVNDAGYHYFRENAGTPVKKSAAAPRASFLAAASAVGLALTMTGMA